MVTRVPLILRLYHIETNETEIVLKYGKTSKILISEDDIPMAIEKATSEITGDSSGVSRSPITLVVKKRGITDLTLVDFLLYPVAAPINTLIYVNNISGIVQEYTKPEEAIILNVIHANQDFATTNSLEMSQVVDPSGQRTLTVITKCDCLDSPLFADKLTSNKLNIGLGFICVRNRIGEESIKEAEHAEESLFSAHPVLSTIDKAMVGIPVLMNIMRKFLPQVIAKIDDTLESLYLERSKMPRQLNNDAEAMDAFMRLAASLRSAIHEFSGDSNKTARKARIMSCSAKLDSLLKRLHDDLSKTEKDYGTFLSDEVEFVKANTGLRLPGGFSQNLFDLLLREKVEDIRNLPSKCAADALAYFEKGCMNVVYDQFSSHYPQVLPIAQDAARKCMNYITEIVMERTEEITTMQWYDFTIDSIFLNAYEKFKSENKDILLSALDSEMGMANLLVFGKVNVAHLRIIPSSIRDHAFELRMRLELYWTFVVTRIVDSLAQRLRMMLADAETKIEQLMVRNVLGETGRVSKLMGEPESMTKRRDYLQETISVLKKSRDVLASISP
ncbi:dynamin-related protein 4C-like protein [Tanacetum coccineum]